jgi:hypothetical protein
MIGTEPNNGLNGYVRAHAQLHSPGFCNLQRLTITGMGLAVCVFPQSYMFTSLTIGVSGDNSSADNCRIEPCFKGDCTCRNIFGNATCGTLSSSLEIIIINFRLINNTWTPVGNCCRLWLTGGQIHRKCRGM